MERLGVEYGEGRSEGCETYPTGSETKRSRSLIKTKPQKCKRQEGRTLPEVNIEVHRTRKNSECRQLYSE